jgi:Arc/MetJ family transcription regulator
LLKIIHMRTNIDIDDQLMEKALKAGNSKTKKQVVEKALELYVRMQNQEKLLNLWGKIEIDDEPYK